MVTVVAKWKFKQGQLENARPILNQLVSATRSESGNICYDLYHSANDPEQILLFEQYSDDAAFAEHRSSRHFQSLAIGYLIPLLENRTVQVFKQC